MDTKPNQTENDDKASGGPGTALETTKKKDATDFFIEEYGDSWPLEMVRFNRDDGGSLMEIFVEESRAGELRLLVPHRYRDICTIVIAVYEGWGKE